MADRLGTQVGNYRLTHLLGQGGFAEVYLGEHIHLGTKAAIKLLHASLASSGEIEKFREEARIIATLQHPHILRVLEFGIEAGQPYLVLEHAPGGSLRERHPSGTQVPLATVATYVQQIAQALQYAHDQKLIHRDIKPQNLLLGRTGEILLSDFGISVVAESTNRQQAQGFAGTVAYSAPEQLQEYPRPASDQYALGVVVYEWLTGKLPFTGAFQEVIAKHLFAAPPSLCEQLPSLPATVEQVVLTALAKDPKERFVSVNAFASALERASQTALSALPSVTPAPSTQPSGTTLAGTQAPLPTIGATPNLAPPSASPSVSLPTTGQRAPGVHSSLEGPVATEAVSGRWQSASAPPPTLASTRTLLPAPTDSAPAMPPSPHSAPSGRKKPVGRILAACILLLLLVGGSLVGVGLAGNGPFSGLVVKASATPIATATLLPAGTITEFTLPPDRDTHGITAGPDGNLWFTEYGGSRIGRITPVGTVTEFHFGPEQPWGITAGPDGNLWFTDISCQIGRITPSGTITEFPLRTCPSDPFDITVGPDGNLWFTENYGSQIGRITPSGAIAEFPLPIKHIPGPVGISAGPDGNLWFTEGAANKIGRITPTGTITEFAVPTSGSNPGEITRGPDGNLWFTEGAANKIGRITPSGAITEFAVPHPQGGITSGPDGNLWFTEFDKIGRITPSGIITEFALPGSGKPVEIALGPDGNLWFTEGEGGKIGRITTGK